MKTKRTPAMTPSPHSDHLKDALEAEDKDAFREAVEPLMDTLLQAARQDLDYYVEERDLHEQDLTAEEVVGETLLHAWETRTSHPEGMSMRGWFLGTQHRVLTHLIGEIKHYRQEKAISLDEQIPPDKQSAGELARRQYGTDPEMVITWEEVTPSTEPTDVEAPLFTNRDTFHLDPDSRHVAMMHHEFDVPLHEVAAIMERSVEDTAQLLGEAHASLRERIDNMSGSA